MEIGKLGQSLTSREILELIQHDLERVEREISLESIASVDAVTTIGRYLQSGGGKRLRPLLVLLAARACGHHIQLRQRGQWSGRSHALRARRSYRLWPCAGSLRNRLREFSGDRAIAVHSGRRVDYD